MNKKRISFFAAIAVLLAAIAVSFIFSGRDNYTPAEDIIDSIAPTQTENADNAAQDGALQETDDIASQHPSEDGKTPSSAGSLEDFSSQADKPDASMPDDAKEATKAQNEEPKTPSFTLRVVCHTLVGNTALPEEKRVLVPEDGVIFEGDIEIKDSQNAFELIKAALTEHGIHLDFADVGGAYIKAIGNLYEKDCGNLSGWMYSINGEFASVGISSCIPQDGDVIEFAYTCDIGRDLK